MSIEQIAYIIHCMRFSACFISRRAIGVKRGSVEQRGSVELGESTSFLMCLRQ